MNNDIEQNTGVPEHYMVSSLDKDKDIDTAALNCALLRADSIILLLQNNFEGETTQISNLETVYALWAVEGLINQAKILISGK